MLKYAVEQVLKEWSAMAKLAGPWLYFPMLKMLTLFASAMDDESVT